MSLMSLCIADRRSLGPAKLRFKISTIAEYIHTYRSNHDNPAHLISLETLPNLLDLGQKLYLGYLAGVPTVGAG
jgi:hypothetical protein